MTEVTYHGNTIVVYELRPPIPIRAFDFVAYIEGREESGPYGYGPTATLAVGDLVEQLLEEEDNDEHNLHLRGPH